MSACSCGGACPSDEQVQVLLTEGGLVRLQFAGVTAELGWRDSLRLAEAFKHAGEAICAIHEVSEPVRDRVFMEACAAATRATLAAVAELTAGGGS